MSLLKKELTEKSGFTMEFSVSKDAYDKAEVEAYKKLVKNMTVPGFRKGKAPKHVVERLYGKGVFSEDFPSGKGIEKKQIAFCLFERQCPGDVAGDHDGVGVGYDGAPVFFKAQRIIFPPTAEHFHGLVRFAVGRQMQIGNGKK